MQDPRRHRLPLLARWGLAALLVAACGAIGADEPPAPPAPEAAAEAAAAPAPETPEAEPAAARRPAGLAAGGLRAHIDPQTGTLTMPPRKQRFELSLRLREMFSTSHEGLEVIHFPSGFSAVDLKGRFYSGSMATVGADGEVTITHGLPAAPGPEPAGEPTPEAGEDRP